MARPPKPNPNFVWIPKHRIQMGVIIPGHWEYKGKKHKKSSSKKRHHKKYKSMIGGFRGRR